ncbi:MAG: bifunctional diaminohydroxyphosphoribosylaminopyrimidine deaminase/5-amino-6-(5-phosphoribosylamino)uracil reductase RibD [Puniceicoccales bacterium]|jgi:diaminohydroxyphosphoribosylaminopyrimidine deaminase/5-amino-6-(5-phosphoribosylamino)uracil reductase|nr:bifunctional diaminohydroxyphosphoribosylaminopyrimidine deaminase/5-amino-6-(5-phosphoribosylamino)uracil reductase RibD [Puniceicoccales bacterium]
MDEAWQNWMRRALALAQRAWGDTHPNPLVGALIVENDRVVAEGWHERAGGPHAEINALRALGRPPRKGASLVVTLEPCSTQGRTGACTEAILKAGGIARVIAGATDLSRAHAGNGFDVLRTGGIDVVTGVLAGECADLNLIFNHWAAHSRTFVALKTASTLDGRIATRAGQSRWITGPEARADVMRWRRYFPAIASSAVSVMADDARLTSRCADGAAEWCPAARFVFDRSLRLAEAIAKGRKLRVFEDAFAGRTTVVSSNAMEHSAQAAVLRRHGAALLFLPTENDSVFFETFKRHCADTGLTGVWVEGGAKFLGAWLRARTADYLFHYTAPVVMGDAQALPAFEGKECPSLADATVLHEVRRTSLGNDTLTRGRF